MEAFFVVNLIVAVGLLFSPLWWSRKLLNQDWLNPVSLMVICAMPVDLFRLFVGQLFNSDGFLMDPANLMDQAYQFAILMTNLQQMIGLTMLVFAARLRVSRTLPHKIPRMGTYSRVDFRLLSKIFFLLYIVAFLILAMRTGGVGAWLADIRGSYIEKRDGNGVFYAAAVSFLSISYFFYGLIGSGKIKFGLVSLVYFFAIYILGSKGFILQYMIFFLIIIKRQGQVNVGRALIIGVPFVFTLLLINFASQSGQFDFTSVVEYFNYYPNATMYFKDYFDGSMPLFQGKVFFTSFWEYVPRSLFPDKPYVYGILHIVEIYYPGGAESGNTPAFQGGVPEFADFGLPGVLLFALLDWSTLIQFIGLTYALKERAFLNHGPMSGRTILISLILFAPAFGTFLPAGLVFVLLLLVVTLSKFVQMVRRTLSPT